MSLLIIAAIAGVLVGLVVGILGAGGGILAVPILVYVLGQDPHSAAAASLVIVGATALVALPTHRKQVRWRQGASFAVLALLGAILGSRLNLLVSPDILMYLFSSMLIMVALAMFKKALGEYSYQIRPRQPGAKKQSSAWYGDLGEHDQSLNKPLKTNFVVLFSASMVTGVLTGFFGVGGGFIVVPMLVLAMRMNIFQAAATSLFIMVLTSATGLVSRLGANLDIDWLVVAVFTMTSMICAIAGGSISKRIKPWILTLAFAILLAAVGFSVLITTIST